MMKTLGAALLLGAALAVDRLQTGPFGSDPYWSHKKPTDYFDNLTFTVEQ